MKVSEAINDLKVGDEVWVKGKVGEIDTDNFPLKMYTNSYKNNWVWLDKNDEISLTEPKRWVVKKGKDCVLTSFTFFDEQSVNYDSNSYGQDYMYFTDKAKAEAVATLVEGQVEEVAD